MLCGSSREIRAIRRVPGSDAETGGAGCVWMWRGAERSVDCASGAGALMIADIGEMRAARALYGRAPCPPSVLAVLAAVSLSGCASAPLAKGGSLSSYDNMAPSDGMLAKSLVRVS